MDVTEFLNKAFNNECPQYITTLFQEECLDVPTLTMAGDQDLEAILERCKIGHRICLRAAIQGIRVRQSAPKIYPSENVEGMAAIKERLSLLEQRNAARLLKNQLRNQRHKMKVKSEVKEQAYVVRVGVKKLQRGKWVRSTMHRIARHAVKRSTDYLTMLEEIRRKLNILTTVEDCLILDASDTTIPPENFNFFDSIIKQKKYVGATRLYVGIKPQAPVQVQGPKVIIVVKPPE